MSELGQEISKNVFDSFIEKVSNDKKIKVLGKKIKNTTDYEVANEYAVRVGELASEALQEETKGLAYISNEVAKELLEPVLTADYEIVKEVVKQVQQNMNNANGLGLEVMTPDLDTSRIQGLVEKVSSYATAEEGNWVLGEPIVNYTQAIVDQSIHKNAKTQSKMGLEPVIIRKTEASGTKYRKIRRGNKTYSYPYQVPCEWCINLAGTYDYADNWESGNIIFRRHEQCRCTVTYKQGSMTQDVWSKKTFWGNDDAEKQAEIVEKVSNIKENQKQVKMPDNSITQELGEPYYKLMHEKLDGKQAEKLYAKYEDKVKIINNSSKSAYYSPLEKGIYFDQQQSLMPTRPDHKQLSVFFHESGHNIDAIAGSEKGRRFYSSYYKDGEFVKTIKDEVQERIKEKGDILKTIFKDSSLTKDEIIDKILQEGAISDFDARFLKNGGGYKPFKYEKSMAYRALQEEVRQLTDAQRGNLSDILEGATNGRIKCGYGHGASYWKQSEELLGTEAFAEMIDSQVANDESLEIIKQYLPKSYKVFEEMLDAMVE